MKRFLASATAVVLFTLIFGNRAFATLGTAELEIVSGGTTLYVMDNGSVTCAGCATSAGDTNPATGVINVNATGLNGWNISINTGSSNSPNCSGMNGPGCLDDTTITTTVSGASTLTAYFADSGFSTEPGFIVSESASSITGTGSTATIQGFRSTVALPAPSSLSTLAGTQLGSTLSLGVGGGFTQTSAAGPFTGPQNLELVAVFTSGSGGGSFNVDGNIAAAVPEPSAVILFGTVLTCLASFLRKKAANRS